MLIGKINIPNFFKFSTVGAGLVRPKEILFFVLFFFLFPHPVNAWSETDETDRNLTGWSEYSYTTNSYNTNDTCASSKANFSSVSTGDVCVLGSNCDSGYVCRYSNSQVQIMKNNSVKNTETANCSSSIQIKVYKDGNNTLVKCFCDNTEVNSWSDTSPLTWSGNPRIKGNNMSVNSAVYSNENCVAPTPTPTNTPTPTPTNTPTPTPTPIPHIVVDNLTPYPTSPLEAIGTPVPDRLYTHEVCITPTSYNLIYGTVSSLDNLFSSTGSDFVSSGDPNYGLSIDITGYTNLGVDVPDDDITEIWTYGSFDLTSGTIHSFNHLIYGVTGENFGLSLTSKSGYLFNNFGNPVRFSDLFDSEGNATFTGNFTTTTSVSPMSGHISLSGICFRYTDDNALDAIDPILKSELVCTGGAWYENLFCSLKNWFLQAMQWLFVPTQLLNSFKSDLSTTFDTYLGQKAPFAYVMPVLNFDFEQYELTDDYPLASFTYMSDIGETSTVPVFQDEVKNEFEKWIPPFKEIQNFIILVYFIIFVYDTAREMFTKLLS